jgi:hypothetical protein
MHAEQQTAQQRSLAACSIVAPRCSLAIKSTSGVKFGSMMVDVNAVMRTHASEPRGYSNPAGITPTIVNRHSRRVSARPMTSRAPP